MSAAATAVPPKDTWSLVWFAQLERCIAEGNFAGALEAKEQLRRLGVIVIFRRRPYVTRSTNHAL